MCCAMESRTRAVSSSSRISAPRAGSTRRRAACTRRTSSLLCARFTTARSNDQPSPGLRPTGKSLDLVLFLNGIPIVTAELKNPLNGQDVEDAIRQYKTDRDPREPLLAYGRCLGHFAIDPDLVYVTTKLAGPKTRFLPFNQGKYGGAGNPP